MKEAKNKRKSRYPSEDDLQADSTAPMQDESAVDVSEVSVDGYREEEEEPEEARDAEEERDSSSGPQLALAPIDALQRYLADIRRYPRLNVEEERELIYRYYTEGDSDAARRLITGNLRLVVKIALEFRRNLTNLLDLIQEGNIGLLQALKKFDPVRKVRFSSYATWWVKAYILRFILNNWSHVRFATSNERRRIFFNLNKEKRKLEAAGIVPGTKMLAESLQVSEADILDVEPMISGGDVSLDQKVSEDYDVSPMETLAAKEPLPDQMVAEDEFQQILRRKLAAFGETLKSRERTIFQRRLLAEEPVKLQQLGDEFGVTREAVRLMEKKIVQRLKEYLQTELQGIREFQVSIADSQPSAGVRGEV